jgi:hypothetical protein
VILVRKITTPLVIGEIPKVKKNRYGHIDRSFLRAKRRFSRSGATAQCYVKTPIRIAPLRGFAQKVETGRQRREI